MVFTVKQAWTVVPIWRLWCHLSTKNEYPNSKPLRQGLPPSLQRAGYTGSAASRFTPTPPASLQLMTGRREEWSSRGPTQGGGELSLPRAGWRACSHSCLLKRGKKGEGGRWPRVAACAPRPAAVRLWLSLLKVYLGHSPLQVLLCEGEPLGWPRHDYLSNWWK